MFVLKKYGKVIKWITDILATGEHHAFQRDILRILQKNNAAPPQV